jgi:anti-anti-sigma factor
MTLRTVELTNGILETQVDGDTLIVTPCADLSELEFERIQRDASTAFALLAGGKIANAVIDFGNSDYFGSTALGFLVTLGSKVRKLHGRMALCNLSAHGYEELRIMKLDHLWPICQSKALALQAVRKRGE